MKDNLFYKLVRIIVSPLFKVFLRPKYIGLENIPTEGRVILAGTHTSIMDCIYLISSTKRQIHFMAKSELWSGVKGIIFSHLGLIKVDRSKKNPEAIHEAEEYLNNELVVGIFPEGTTEKKRGLLPFKKGSVVLSKNTNSPIIPFVIKGKYRLFSKDLTIKFLDPIYITDDIDKENERLYNLIKKELNNE